MPGPRPIPTKLKILKGNPGKRALPKDEPQPRIAPLSCPRWLHRYAREEWRRIVPELEAVGMVSVVDVQALAACCQAYARWRQAEEAISKARSLTMVGARGTKVMRPEVDASQKYLEKYRAFCAEFGLTPASRSRLSVEKKKPKSAMEELLMGDS